MRKLLRENLRQSNLKAAEDYDLPVPEFQVFDDMFRVNLFRNPLPIKKEENIGEASEKN